MHTRTQNTAPDLSVYAGYLDEEQNAPAARPMRTIDQAPTESAPPHVGHHSIAIFDPDMLDAFERMANLMATARVTVPKHLVGSAGDCLAIVMQAARWGMDPFAVAQKTHLVNGVLGYEAQLVNAVISSSDLLKSRLDYEWFGPWEKVIGKFTVNKNRDGKEYRTPAWSAEDEEGCGVRVWSTLRGEQKPRELELLLAQARTRNSTLWADDPRQQLAYLAAKRWARLHAPDVLLGVYTPDELEEIPERDMGPAQVIDEPAARTSRSSRTAGVKEKLRRKAQEDSPVTLAVVMGAIGNATNMKELKAAGEMASQLGNDSDQEQAREAWRARQQELKAQAQAAKTAEEKPAEPDPEASNDEPAHLATLLLERIHGADSAAKLDEYRDDIEELPAPFHDELIAEFQKAHAKFNTKK